MFNIDILQIIFDFTDVYTRRIMMRLNKYVYIELLIKVKFELLKIIVNTVIEKHIMNISFFELSQISVGLNEVV